MLSLHVASVTPKARTWAKLGDFRRGGARRVRRRNEGMSESESESEEERGGERER